MVILLVANQVLIPMLILLIQCFSNRGAPHMGGTSDPGEQVYIMILFIANDGR